MQQPAPINLLPPTSLPSLRPKKRHPRIRIRIRNLNRRIHIIHGILRDQGAPPLRHRRIRHIQREHDHNRGNSQSDIQPRGGDVVESRPPPAVAVLDVLLEDVPHDSPGEVIERCGGGDLARAAEEEGRVDVFDWGLGKDAGAVVD